ncbi:unnamed protein product [Lactuca virosa]|uniref:Uncharacterized protein n=1 Tax=Lactuca virosa TaxID=75947 RepID=A0AAU9MZA8_9ASTR|nr:unnamed protein product [Lactuca virosa]
MSNTSVNFIYVCCFNLSPKNSKPKPEQLCYCFQPLKFCRGWIRDTKRKKTTRVVYNRVIAVRFESKSLWIGWHFGSG